MVWYKPLSSLGGGARIFKFGGARSWGLALPLVDCCCFEYNLGIKSLFQHNPFSRIAQLSLTFETFDQSGEETKMKIFLQHSSFRQEREKYTDMPQVSIKLRLKFDDQSVQCCCMKWRWGDRWSHISYWCISCSWILNTLFPQPACRSDANWWGRIRIN